MCRRFIFSVNLPSFLYGLEDSDLLLHIPFLPCLPNYFLNLVINAFKLLAVFLLVADFILFQGFQLLRLPHGPVIAFLSLFCPVPVHIPDHGRHQLIFDPLKRLRKIIFVMLHSSTLLPQRPVQQSFASDHHLTIP